MKKIILFLFITICICKTSKIIAQVNVQDSLALVDLYDSTDGAHWFHNTNWLTMQPISTWSGIGLDNSGTRVRSIFLNGYGLSGKIPESLGNLTEVTYLYLYGNQITALPESIGNLAKLNYLYVQDNKLTRLPESFGSLRYLSNPYILSGNELDSLPESFVNLEIYQLYLQNNKLKKLPKSFSRLKYLNLIDLENNELTELPESFGNLPSLREAHLANNKLQSLPSSIGNLKATMNVLDLTNNKLTSLPHSFDSLKHVWYLSLAHNKLGNFDHLFEPVNYVLQFLDLSDNNITTLPPFLKHFGGLVSLRVNNNPLNRLPEWVYEISNNYIQYLEFKNDQLIKLPSTVGKMVSLQKLDLSGNNLRTLPHSFKHLTNLTTLTLSNNEFEDFPNAIQKLRDALLDNLYLDHNRLTGKLPFFLHRQNVSDHHYPISKVNVSYNYYTFDAGEFLIQRHIFDYHFHHNQTDFSFSPQANIPLNNSLNTLSVYAGGTLSHNTYKWYKDGSIVATNVGDSTYQPTLSGAYNVVVTNAIATRLTLYSDTINFSAGKSTTAKVIAVPDKVVAQNKTAFILYPNPAKDNLDIAINASQDENVQIEIVSMDGKIISSSNTKISSGSSTQNVRISSLAKGSYFVRIKANDEETSEKFVKE